MDSSISAKINNRILMLQKEKERVLNNYPFLVYEGEKSISEVLNLVIGMEINFLKELLNNNSDGENWEQKCRELQKHNSELWEAFGNFCQAVNDQFNKNIQFMPPPIQQPKI